MPSTTDVLSACLRLSRSLHGNVDASLTVSVTSRGTVATLVASEEPEQATAPAKSPADALDTLHRMLRAMVENRLEVAREAHRKAAEALKAVEDALVEEES